MTYKDVVWDPPVSHECALSDCDCLNIERHRVLAIVVNLLVILSVATRGDYTFKVPRKLFGFW